jgi:4-amino-4-deoxy-L-arabinose transferase-like glycosyltransferase
LNILTQTIFTRYAKYFENAFNFAVKKFLESRSSLGFSIALQIIWFAVILLTGTSQNWPKILFLSLYSLLAGISIIFLPSRLISHLREITSRLLNRERRLLVLLLMFGLAAGILYAFFQQPWADEERSLSVARVVSKEGIASAYETSGWLRTRHPPLIPLLYGFVIDLRGDRLFFLRVASTLFFSASLVLTYLVGRELYDRKTGFLASLFFLSFPLSVRLGASAMMDMQLTFFFLLAVYLALHLIKTPSIGLTFALGITIGLGLLTKYTMVLVYGVLLSLFFFNLRLRNLRPMITTTVLISAGIFAVWLLYANSLGILSGQIEKITNYSGIYHAFKQAGFNLQNDPTGHVENNPAQERDLAHKGIIQLGLETLFTRIPASLGLYQFPFILLGGFFILTRRTTADLFVLLWIAVVFIIIFLTLPDHRYFLPAFPALAILIARLFSRSPDQAERTLLISFVLSSSILFLMADWTRDTYLFIENR